MNPEAQAAHEAIMVHVGLPADTALVVFGRGKVRHVRMNESEYTRDVGRVPLTWCNMFWIPRDLRLADRDEDATMPICRACLRTQEATEARLAELAAELADELAAETTASS